MNVSGHRRRRLHRQPHLQAPRGGGSSARRLRRPEPGPRVGREVGAARARVARRSGAAGRGAVRGASRRRRRPLRRQRAGRRVDDRPGKYFRNNTLGTFNLLEAMRAAGVGTIVFSSTCATYGDPVRVPIDEDHPQAPVNPYGESKLMVEKMLRWYGECHGLRWMALRYFNAAGADPDGEIGEDHDPESHLIPLVIGGTLGTRPPVKVFGDRLPDAGRHRRPRLHPRRRSGRRAPARDRAPRRRHAKPGDQSGHRRRAVGAAGHRHRRRR